MEGSAVINRPVYVGDGYPLLPDFADLNSEYTDPITSQREDIIEQRANILRLINLKRS